MTIIFCFSRLDLYVYLLESLYALVKMLILLIGCSGFQSTVAENQDLCLNIQQIESERSGFKM